MNHPCWLKLSLLAFAGVVTMSVWSAEPGQAQPDKKEFDKKDFFGKKDFGGFGGPMGQRRLLVAQFDKDGDGRLNAEERKAAREFLRTQGGGKGGFGKKGPGGFGKGGFNPSVFMVKPLVDALDTDKDGKLAQAEIIAGIKKFFADNDKDKKGTLDETQIADGINAIVPPPSGFPGGPKDGFKGPKDGAKGPKGFGFGPGPIIASEVVKRADSKKTGRVTLAELTAAAETLFKELDKDKTGKLDEAAVGTGLTQLFPGPGGKGGIGKGGFGKGEPAKPGPKVAVADVKSHPDAKLYDTSILRTIFIEFDNKADWEAELADFYHTDVEVPATITVDGKKYTDVGIHFRGNSSYFMAPVGYKHSLNLSFDFVDTKQRLYGYKTLNLLNGAEDPTFMHSVLYCNLSRKYIAAPQANFVKVVINGESWGIYANQQQFNKEFTKENYGSAQGARWRIPGHPGASGGGLSYLGENIADYKRHYTIKSKDNDKDWKALIALCKVLDKTPADKLEEALRPILDVEAVLWFLALDNATINDDGYWTRASDYSLYRDPKGKFHISPYDTNETFMPMGGGKGGPGGKGPKDGGKGPKDGGFGKGGFVGGKGGYGLDPLIGVNNSRMPLYRLLSVPNLKAKYLDHMRTIANDLDWKKLGPVVGQYRTLIEKEVEIDTRKLYSLAEFRASTADTAEGSRHSLRAFADGRRSYLLNHAEIKKLDDR